MMHSRLSINALSSFNWSFDQDLALWKELGVHHAGLLISKMEPDREAKVAQLRAAGGALAAAPRLRPLRFCAQVRSARIGAVVEPVGVDQPR